LQRKSDTDDSAVQQFLNEAIAALNGLGILVANSIQGKDTWEELLRKSSTDISGVSTPIKILIYVDEAHYMTPVDERKRSTDHKTKTSYDKFLWCLNELRGASNNDLFTIFMSTNSEVSHLAPSADVAPSLRYRDQGAAMQAPITETPFDCAPFFHDVNNERLTVAGLSSPKHLSRFGRPL
jgi:hypothetical protein